MYPCFCFILNLLFPTVFFRSALDFYFAQYMLSYSIKITNSYFRKGSGSYGFAQASDSLRHAGESRSVR